LETTIIGEFDTRRETELVAEHVVQECGVARGDVFVQPAGEANSVGTRESGADVKDAPEPDGQQKLEGAIEVSVDFHGGDPKKIADALKSTGAKLVRTSKRMPGLKHSVTPDGRYFVVRGKLWRMSDPDFGPDEKAHLVKRLMDARRSVKKAKAARDPDAESAAHRLVDQTKRGLGERGPVWWKDGAPDLNRHAVKNTPYADWYTRLRRRPSCNRDACGEAPAP
jgi:hypothetical protein